jgi:hypothetical protein
MNGKVIAKEFLKPGKVAAVKAVLRLPHNLG